jgi:hypothetical protein
MNGPSPLEKTICNLTAINVAINHPFTRGMGESQKVEVIGFVRSSCGQGGLDVTIRL